MEREIEGGREAWEMPLPALVSAQKGLNEPRYASLKGIMAAKKKPLEVKDAAALGLSAAEVERRLDRLAAESTIVRAAGRVYPAGAWRGVEASSLAVLEAFHRDEPLRSGMRREDLRSRVARGWSPEVFRAALDGLVAKPAVRLEGDRVALAGHRVVLSDDDLSIAGRLEGMFRAAGLEPPDADAALPPSGRMKRTGH